MTYPKQLEAKRLLLSIQARALACAFFLRDQPVPEKLKQILAATKSLEALEKYNPNWQSQPRVPSGNPNGGRWTSGGTGSPKPSSNINPPKKPKRPTQNNNSSVMKHPKRIMFSSEGAKEILRSEGFESHIYLDINGHPTIGYGHKLLQGETFPNGITKEEGLKIYMQDMRIAERAVQRYTKTPLSQGQFDVLVSLTYNIGQGAYRASTLLKLLNQGKYREAANEILKWNKSSDGKGGLKPDKGLTNRRRRDFNMFIASTPKTYL